MSTKAEPLQGEALMASLTVKDLEKSAAWYTGVVGFTEVRRTERDGKLRSIAVQAGNVRINLNQDDGARGWERVKGEGFSFTVSVTQSVDAVAAHIKAHGGTLDTEPADMPWGVRAFRIRDPDGYKWSVSRPLNA
ncbi:MAG TPA: VOC family protein [Gemmatimonadales bacterium]|nr:VOC family protein [Gemmatimonadales bacterium]